MPGSVQRGPGTATEPLAQLLRWARPCKLRPPVTPQRQRRPCPIAGQGAATRLRRSAGGLWNLAHPGAGGTAACCAGPGRTRRRQCGTAFRSSAYAGAGCRTRHCAPRCGGPRHGGPRHGQGRRQRARAVRSRTRAGQRGISNGRNWEGRAAACSTFSCADRIFTRSGCDGAYAGSARRGRRRAANRAAACAARYGVAWGCRHNPACWCWSRPATCHGWTRGGGANAGWRPGSSHGGQLCIAGPAATSSAGDGAAYGGPTAVDAPPPRRRTVNPIACRAGRACVGKLCCQRGGPAQRRPASDDPARPRRARPRAGSHRTQARRPGPGRAGCRAARHAADVAP